MKPERKGCGLAHAVNGGFSFACGHCARANEPAGKLQPTGTTGVATAKNVAQLPEVGIIDVAPLTATECFDSWQSGIMQPMYSAQRDILAPIVIRCRELAAPPNPEHLDAATLGDTCPMAAWPA